MEREWLKQTSIYWRKGAGDTFVTGSLSGGAAMLKDVVDFASFILGAVKGVKADKKDRLQGVAKLLGQIADCIQRIINASREGSFSSLVGNCEELGAYFGRFAELDLGPFLTGQDKELLRKLEEAISARKGMIFSWNFSEKEKTTIELNLIQMEIAAGNFRAAQNLLMATA